MSERTLVSPPRQPWATRLSGKLSAPRPGPIRSARELAGDPSIVVRRTMDVRHAAWSGARTLRGPAASLGAAGAIARLDARRPLRRRSPRGPGRARPRRGDPQLRGRPVRGALASLHVRPGGVAAP